MWWMLGIFVGAMLGLGYLVDKWIDNKYNPEKYYERKAKR